jgi:RNA polymerase sigma-70 factor, ECF subfamily
LLVVATLQHTRNDEPESELITALQNGDRNALAGLYRLHKDKVYSIALHFFHGDTAVAADVTQQVFLKVMVDAKSYKGASAFSTWLYRLVVNTCIDTSRRRGFSSSSFSGGKQRELQFPDGEPPRHVHSDLPTPAEALVTKERAEAVQKAVGALPEPFRIAVLLRHFEEFSYEEMAEALQVSMGTVASRLNRAHRLLARSLARIGGGHGS